MSDLRIIRAKEVERRTGYTLGHIWRLEKENEFPRRLRLGANAVGWYEHEIDAWIKSRVRGGSRPFRRIERVRLED